MMVIFTKIEGVREKGLIKSKQAWWPHFFNLNIYLMGYDLPIYQIS